MSGQLFLPGANCLRRSAEHSVLNRPSSGLLKTDSQPVSTFNWPEYLKSRWWSQCWDWPTSCPLPTWTRPPLHRPWPIAGSRRWGRERSGQGATGSPPGHTGHWGGVGCGMCYLWGAGVRRPGNQGNWSARPKKNEREKIIIQKLLRDLGIVAE